MKNSSLSCAALLAFSLFTAQQALAKDVSLAASVGQEGVYNSNPLMLRQGEKTLWGSTTYLTIGLQKENLSSAFLWDVRVNENVFNLSDFNSTDLHTNAKASWSTERWTLETNTQLAYDTTRTSDDSSSGTSTSGSRHLGVSVSPKVSFRASQTSIWGIGGLFQQASYDDTTNTDYRVASLTPSYTHIFDPRNQSSILVSMRRYETLEGLKKYQDSASSSLGWTHKFAERFILQATAGLQASRAHGEGALETDISLQSIFSAKLNFHGTQDNFDITATRSQSPSSDGNEPLVTRLSFSNTHAINDNLRWTTELNYQFSDYEDDQALETEHFIKARSGLSYRLNNALALGFHYQYRYETLTKSADTIQDHSGIISLTYKPTSWSLGF